MAQKIITQKSAGQIFHCLTVLEEYISNKQRWWKCQCTCGNFFDSPAISIKIGRTKSCGCLKKQRIAALNRTHGQSHTPTYETWLNMRRRVYDPTNKRFARYGGRGITICPQWESFENFLADMGKKPAGMSLERKDNDGPYAVWNCKWATPREQSRNRRGNHPITFQGRTMLLTDWAKELGITHGGLIGRIRRNGIERALTMPKRLLRQVGCAADLNPTSAIAKEENGAEVA